MTLGVWKCAVAHLRAGRVRQRGGASTGRSEIREMGGIQQVFGHCSSRERPRQSGCGIPAQGPASLEFRSLGNRKGQGPQYVGCYCPEILCGACGVGSTRAEPSSCVESS